ncbi:hypothetical protein K490DRAFT_65100 [Saccharata proteae CBS 121410]|uniref:Alb1-domain-containing protein n=1 Tax=Saccharata proteae CBS 121410 TaxID=1314787 RepID=A0A9P4HWN2_9PEZI|nr:hypothetical protein K490DRAFT_65100 [Saccharata proteae CBS 121410]
MAKTAKVKKRPVSERSRAARRAESPSLNLDKSILEDASSLPSSKKGQAQAHPSVLAAQNAGISKKNKGKHMTHQQRMRQEKALERADANMDKLEKKREKSMQGARRVQSRRKDWEALNGDTKTIPPAADKAKNDEDEIDMEDGAAEGPLSKLNAATVFSVGPQDTPNVGQATKGATAADDEDDEVI